jgi:phospholipid/cholesterol/gamma-HCH transport system substrate-binding protein
MDYIFLQAAAINGFDTIGHYLRAVLIVNTCTSYNARTEDPACSANFKKGEAAAATAARAKPTVASVDREIAAGRTPALARTDAVQRGLDPALFSDAAIKQRAAKRAAAKRKAARKRAATQIKMPRAFLPGQDARPSSSSGAAPATPATAANPATDGAQPASSGAQGGGTNTNATLLNYLLGG